MFQGLVEKASTGRPYGRTEQGTSSQTVQGVARRGTLKKVVKRSRAIALSNREQDTSLLEVSLEYTRDKVNLSMKGQPLDKVQRK